MKNIRNDYCIKMFTGNEPLRPALSNVSLDNGYLYATNAHMGAKIKSDLCMHEYKPVDKYPNVEKLFIDHESKEKKVVSVDTLFNDLMKIECCFRPKMIACNDCDNGTATCDHCDSEYDCKKCGGAGEVAGKEMELASEHDCILFGKRFKLNFLDLIIRTAVYTGVKEIEISHGINALSGSIFTVGCFTILIMPVATPEP